MPRVGRMFSARRSRDSLSRGADGFIRTLIRRASSRTAVSLQSLQVAAHFGSVLISKVAIFLQRLIDDLFQPRREVGIEASGRGRHAIQDGVENHRRSVAAKR